MQGTEGVVLRMTSGLLVKMKTKWWQQADLRVYLRWPTEHHRRAAQVRHLHKLKLMEYPEMRAVVKNWPGDAPPARVLDMFPKAKKVEARYAREGGKRRTIIVSFADSDSQKQGIAEGGIQGVYLVPSYSRRTSGNSEYRVDRWFSSDTQKRLPRKPSLTLVEAATKVFTGGKKGDKRRFEEACATALEDNVRYDEELASHLAGLMVAERNRQWQQTDPKGYIQTRFQARFAKNTKKGKKKLTPAWLGSEALDDPSTGMDASDTYEVAYDIAHDHEDDYEHDYET